MQQWQEHSTGTVMVTITQSIIFSLLNEAMCGSYKNMGLKMSVGIFIPYGIYPSKHAGKRMMFVYTNSVSVLHISITLGTAKKPCTLIFRCVYTLKQILACVLFIQKMFMSHWVCFAFLNCWMGNKLTYCTVFRRDKIHQLQMTDCGTALRKCSDKDN